MPYDKREINAQEIRSMSAAQILYCDKCMQYILDIFENDISYEIGIQFCFIVFNCEYMQQCLFIHICLSWITDTWVILSYTSDNKATLEDMGKGQFT